MPRDRVVRIQDSLHGLMEFRGMETAVVDVLRARDVQRLRRIRQLGLAHLVFPGAEHSRLAHSLGVAHLAIRFTRQLQDSCRGRLPDLLLPSEAATRDLAVAALCHDLGHGALSHAWENGVIGEHFDRASWAAALGLSPQEPSLAGMKWHELVTQALLGWEDGQLHQLLETHERGFSDRIRRLLRGEYYLPYLPRLLHGDVDIDRGDFLKRDTQQCGVTYGNYDLAWLLSTCLLGEVRPGELVVGFDDRKAVRVVEHFLVARRALYENVYFHKTVHCAEGMVSLFLQRLRQVIGSHPELGQDGFIAPLVRMVAGETVGPEDLLRLDDYSLAVLIDTAARAEPMDETVKDLGRRIVERDLFKIVPVPVRRVQDFLTTPGAYEKLYEAIRPNCPGDPRFYLFVDRSSFKMMMGEPWGSYFVNERTLAATPVRDHEDLRQLWQSPDEFLRLFTLREAVDCVRQVIMSSRS